MAAGPQSCAVSELTFLKHKVPPIHPVRRSKHEGIAVPSEAQQQVNDWHAASYLRECWPVVSMRLYSNVRASYLKHCT